MRSKNAVVIAAVTVLALLGFGNPLVARSAAPTVTHPATTSVGLSCGTCWTDPPS